MSERYRIELKESVFRETPLTESEFDDDLQLVLPSETEVDA
jgi:hypothetical protein